MKKNFLIATMAMLAIAAGLTACTNSPVVEENTTFTLEVRKFNGADANYNPKIDGTLLASKTIDVAAGQINVSEALAVLAPAVDGVHTIKFSDKDYLTFTETTLDYSTSWYLNNGHFEAEPNYIPGDFEWSYMAYNGHYSNGVTVDFLDGLKTYTIVIDGYDGNIGTTPTL